jgi:hypothetical protein
MDGFGVAMVAIILGVFAILFIPLFLATNHTQVCRNYCGTELVIANTEYTDGVLCGCPTNGKVEHILLSKSQVKKIGDEKDDVKGEEIPKREGQAEEKGFE